MWRLRSPRISHLVGGLSQINILSDVKVQHHRCCQTVVSPPPWSLQQTKYDPPDTVVPRSYIGENVSRKDRTKYLYSTLLELNDSKDAVYGALDAWVAWEQSFPIASLKRILNSLEKEQQWHRVVQVIKWMLSKGKGMTMGTYGQLIRALDMDHRVEEAHKFWEMKIGSDLHSVPWQVCHVMISVYYRNNMLEDLVKLFKGLEAFDRKPRDKSIIQKVANAYEMLGLVKEKEKVLAKYSHLFTEEGPTKPHRRNSFESKKEEMLVIPAHPLDILKKLFGFLTDAILLILSREEQKDSQLDITFHVYYFLMT
ncbi:Pentatricopeptide repeat-containing protein [Vigna angularis]|uniref:Pentatricopeptide repeat-containing protein n=1 Tax=Phaseolus angularis TaxID=3914 RepID=A0A8T0JLD8_PHAAN|nr:Pentatricopeptide repeat-containing protein [Vigna angularis]